ncbi:DUF6706 family protein [Capnocytophaga sp.]|uniref:DUF6706 family protein n=1 Tax=Capnocytophaga sp. TaxID=44737 RepID=UPI0026DB07F3|nr:DUF6706 family protein [Capnocytophaga sp.]MDO5106030.1 hypothetical protein [Capnocytophaga sp.]
MMTKRQYILQRFASVGMQLTEADIADMQITNVDDEVTAENQQALYVSFIKFIPMMLLRPTSITEGGVSISRANKGDIEAFYANECNRLGLKNELSTPKPKVIFR